MDGAEIGRALWLEERRKGIGGTDAAAILGFSKWATSYDTWLAKTNRAPKKPDNPAMWWGRELEDLISRRYHERTGRAVWKPPALVYHPDHPVLIGSPDRLVIGQKRGLEIKTASAHLDHEWGAEGTDEVPPAYLIQCAHYMCITGFPVWDVMVLIGGNDDRLYTIRRDESLEAMMIPRLLAWWEMYVEGGIQPPITGAESTYDLIRRRFPLDAAPDLVADPRTEGWVARLQSARIAIANAEAEEREAQNNLMATMGESGGLKGAGWRISWRATRARRHVDWEAMARSYAPSPAELADAIERNTTETPGARRFVFTAGKDRREP